VHQYQKRSSSPNLAAKAYQKKIAGEQAHRDAEERIEAPPEIDRDVVAKHHSMMMAKLMQMQAAQQQAEEKAAFTQADAAKTGEEGQGVQAKGDWQQKADTNAIFSNGSALPPAVMAKYENLMPGVSLEHVSLHQGSQVDAALGAAKLHGLTDGTNIAVSSKAPSGTLEHEIGHVGQRQEKGFSLNEVNRQAYEADADNISANLLSDRPVERFEQTVGKVQDRSGVGKEGDEYENNANAVAAKVAAAESAEQALRDFSETNSGEKQSQGRAARDQHLTSSELSQTIANPSDEVRKLMNLGTVYGAAGDYQEALQFYEEALKLAPNYSFIWYNRGVVLFKLNRLQEALDSNLTALAKDNNWIHAQPSEAWNNIGVILSHLGRFDEALQSYQQALARAPGDRHIQNNLRALEARLSNNPSLRNQSQQAPEPQQGNNLLETLLGALSGAFNENQTGEEAVLDFLIGLIPIIGQVADARDFAAYLYRIVFKKQFNDLWNWIGLALTLIGLVPVVGDIAKYLGKSAFNGNLPALVKNADGVWSYIRSLAPGKFENIARLKGLLAENWGKGVKDAQAIWNTALGQLLNWANGIPDLFFSQQKRQLIEAIQEVSGQSNKMLSQAFDRIWEDINKALDEIGRRINPNGELVTPEGVRLPSDGVDEGVNRPMLSQGSGSQRQPNRALEGIRNVANPKDESLLNSIRERLSRGNMELQELDKGGFGTIYQIPDHPALVIKLATDSQGGINEQLLKEATNLFNLTQKGYPTVYKGVIEWVEPNGMIRQGIVMEKVEGTLSKRILRTGKFSNEPIDPSIEALVRPKTLEDLKRFRQKADNDDIIIEDLQFMISERDGSIYLIDPARVEQLPSRGQQRKEMKRQYLKRIDGIIKQFSDILTKNQR